MPKNAIQGGDWPHFCISAIHKNGNLEKNDAELEVVLSESVCSELCSVNANLLALGS